MGRWRLGIGCGATVVRREGLTWVTWVAVFLGGGVGSVMRFGLGEGMRAWWPEATAGFPWGVLAANVLATALLAWCAVAGADVWGKTSPLWFFMTVGVCGGFSTFSTFAWDTLQLWQQGGWAMAATNVAVSVLGCVAVSWWVAKACA
jgi:CrcB protein